MAVSVFLVSPGPICFTYIFRDCIFDVRVHFFFYLFSFRFCRNGSYWTFEGNFFGFLTFFFLAITVVCCCLPVCMPFSESVVVFSVVSVFSNRFMISAFHRWSRIAAPFVWNGKKCMRSMWNLHETATEFRILIYLCFQYSFVFVVL